MLDVTQDLCIKMEINVILRGSSPLQRQVKNKKTHMNKTMINIIMAYGN